MGHPPALVTVILTGLHGLLSFCHWGWEAEGLLDSVDVCHYGNVQSLQDGRSMLPVRRRRALG